MARNSAGDEGFGTGRGERGWLGLGDFLGPGFHLVFTDRWGGVSDPPYHELNLAFHTGDDPLKVARNREILARAIGLDESRIAYPEQVHGLRVTWVTRRDTGDGAAGIVVPRETDGLLCGERGLALSVLTADCAPVAMGYPGHGVVAMLHAGWRGTVGDIVGAACGLVERETGARPSEARAVIGPCIGPCCYEVDEGRAMLFVEKYRGEEVAVRCGGGWRLDLKRANILNMKRCGIDEERIHVIDGCTCCETRYYSFRREGTTGRQGAFVWMDEKAC